MHVDVVVIESDDIATAVAEEVARDAITKLVLGASSSGIFRRYLFKCHYHIKYHFQKSEEWYLNMNILEWKLVNIVVDR